MDIFGGTPTEMKGLVGYLLSLLVFAPLFIGPFLKRRRAR